MSAEPLPTMPPSSPVPARKKSKPSATRAASVRATRRRSEALRGNTNALKHGVFATVAAWPDVTVEVALTFGTHPDLDEIADARLVEQYALAAVHHRYASLRMGSLERFDAQLGAYASRLGALAERLERAVHERARERRAAHSPHVIDLSRYVPAPAALTEGE